MGEHYAAIISALHTRLAASTGSYGRNGRHTFAACPTCRVHVCITHHVCSKPTER